MRSAPPPALVIIRPESFGRHRSLLLSGSALGHQVLQIFPETRETVQKGFKQWYRNGHETQGAQGLDIGSSNVSLTYDGHFAKYRGSLEDGQKAGWLAFTSVNSRRAFQHEVNGVSRQILMNNDTTGRNSQFITDFGDFGKRVVIEAVKKLKCSEVGNFHLFHVADPRPCHKELGRLFTVARGRKEIPLAELTLKRFQVIELTGCLDPFRDHLQPQVMGQ